MKFQKIIYASFCAMALAGPLAPGMTTLVATNDQSSTETVTENSSSSLLVADNSDEDLP